MGAFKNAIITTQGQALLAKVVAGTTKLEFTKIAISENVLSGDLASKTGIGTIKQFEKVASVVRQNEANVKVSTSFSNEKLDTGYYVRNIGLYATDPQDGEILYSISVADESDATADWMPPFNGIGVSSLLVDLITAVSNASNVNVIVNPSAGATVEQIIELQDQVDDLRGTLSQCITTLHFADLKKQVDNVKTFVGYFEEDDVYGVEIDFANNRFTRLAEAKNLTSGEDFNNLTPWKRKRCIVANDGTVLAYYGDVGYVETGATTTTITKTVDGEEKIYAIGTKVQVMVEQPLFYIKVVPIEFENINGGIQIVKAKYYISSTPKLGFTAPKAFQDNNGVLQDKIYLSAYEGTIYDASANAYLKVDEQVTDFNSDMLASIADAKPASGVSQNLTRANVRKLCNNRGIGWQSHNIYALSVTQWLILIEYASMDSQRNIGRGYCDVASGNSNMSINTGFTSELGNGSGIPTNGTDGKCSVSYRGEENLWGNIWTWLDSINILAKSMNEAYLHKIGETIMDDTTTGYENYGIQLSHSDGYQSRVGYNENHPEVFLPTACGGSDALPIGDYFWQNYTYDGFFIAILGGSWANGSTCGAWCLTVHHASSARGRSIGGRLLYVPQTKVA